MKNTSNFTEGKIMMTLTNLVSSFAMGTTVLLAQQIGCGERKQGGKTVGTAIVMFTMIALLMTGILVFLAPQISSIMNAPAEAFDKTVNYVHICGGGMLVIVAYNLIGCIFRGLGDSRTPLLTVAIACFFNIAGDLILCAGFKLGTEGAAIATVFAQIISVIVSFAVIRKKELPFEMHKNNIRIESPLLRKMVGLGAPIALQDLLVSISFLIILAIVNSMGGDRIRGRRRSGESMRFHHADFLGFHAVHLRFRRTELCGKPHGPCEKGAALRRLRFVCDRCPYVLPVVLPRRPSCRNLLVRCQCRCRCGRLPESLCDRLPFYRGILLLYRFLQRHRHDKIRDEPGNHRRVLRACSGVLLYEPARRRYAFWHRTGDTDVLDSAAGAVPGMYGLSETYEEIILDKTPRNNRSLKSL